MSIYQITKNKLISLTERCTGRISTKEDEVVRLNESIEDTKSVKFRALDKITKINEFLD